MIYRRSIGKAELTIANVATVSRDLDGLVQLFPGIDREELETALGDSKEAVWAFTLIVIRLGDETIVVDTGFGFRTGGSGRSTNALLETAGVDPAAVTQVFVTHGHGDHIGGLLSNGHPSFPSATLVMSRVEHEFWAGDKGVEYFGADGVAPARAAFAAYDGRITLVSGTETFVKSRVGSLTTLPLPGHTPGHTGLRLKSGRKTVDLLVDTIHAQLQLANLSWAPRFDVDSEAAGIRRKEVIADAAAEGRLVQVFHFPFPGLGRFVEQDGRYSWEPESP